MILHDEQIYVKYHSVKVIKLRLFNWQKTRNKGNHEHEYFYQEAAAVHKVPGFLDVKKVAKLN